MQHLTFNNTNQPLIASQLAAVDDLEFVSHGGPFYKLLYHLVRGNQQWQGSNDYHHHLAPHLKTDILEPKKVQNFAKIPAYAHWQFYF